MKKLDYIILTNHINGIVIFIILFILLAGCSSTPPYTLTYHDTQAQLQAARASYGITRTNRINGFWARRGGKDYVHVRLRGQRHTHETLKHEERHVREGQYHE